MNEELERTIESAKRIARIGHCPVFVCSQGRLLFTALEVSEYDEVLGFVNVLGEYYESMGMVAEQ